MNDTETVLREFYDKAYAAGVAAIADAVAKERERCAKVCDEMDEAFVTIYGTDYTDFQNDLRYLQMAAEAIRKGE